MFYYQALSDLINSALPEPTNKPLEKATNKTLGHFACTAALSLAKSQKRKPQELATEILQKLIQTNPNLLDFTETSIAGPGFINFRLEPKALAQDLQALLLQANILPQSTNTETLLVEYVSANPTGDLHLGHGRGAVLGSALVNLHRALGRKVIAEFYINDAGEQMNRLAGSADRILRKQAPEEEDYPANLLEPYLLDREYLISLTIQELRQEIQARILAKQKTVLSRLGVEFDEWISETSEVRASGRFEQTLKDLAAQNLTYEKDGALWLKSQSAGEERDRVLLKSESRAATYLAVDIAYHRYKFERAGELVNVWGADQQGQEVSLHNALRGLGEPAEKLKILYLQLVSLSQDGSELKMSKRAGTVVSVEDLLDEVGADAFRFNMLLSHPNNRFVFDVDLARRADDKNPVFYVQYAYARAGSILDNACSVDHEGNAAFCAQTEIEAFAGDLDLIEGQLSLSQSQDQEAYGATVDSLIALSLFAESVSEAALHNNPSAIAHELIALATEFHTFYSRCRVIDRTNKDLSLLRLNLVSAYRKVLGLGLELLGISRPHRM